MHNDNSRTPGRVAFELGDRARSRGLDLDLSERFGVLFQMMAERGDGWAPINELLAFNLPGYATPSWKLVSFLLFYLRGRAARLLVDPACGASLALSGKLTDGDVAEQGVCLLERADLAEAARPLGHGRVSWVAGWRVPPDLSRPLAYGEPDLIVSLPPLGMVTERVQYASPDGDFVEVADEGGLHVLLTAAQMSPDGEALLLVPSSFLFKRDTKRVREVLPRFGVHVHACLDVVRPLLSGGGIGMSLVSLRRQPTDAVWVAQLTPQSDLQRLADAFRGRRVGRLPEQGRLVDWDEFKGFGRLAASEELERRISRARLSTVPLRDVLLDPLAAAARGDDTEIEPTANTVYLPTYVNAKVVSDSDAVGVKASGRYVLRLDPSRALADYVAAMLNDELGRLLRRSISGGQVIESVRLSELRSLRIPLPTLEDQHAFVRVRHRIGDVRVSLEGLESRLLAKPSDADKVAAQLAHVGASDPLGPWMEVLPFPLASILRRYQADGDTDRKVDHLKRFFEAAAEFFATVLLSIFLADEENVLLQTELPRWLDSQRRIPLERATFGNWTWLGAAMASSARRLASQKEWRGRLSAAFGVSAEDFKVLVTGKELWRELDGIKPERDDDAHGGITSPIERQQKLARLERHLTALRELTMEPIYGVHLIRAGEGGYRNGINQYRKAERLSGFSETFAQEPLDSILQLESEALYLVDRTDTPVRTALKLAPFVQLLAAPSSEKRVAYFYNRIENGRAEFVSHHFEDASRIELDADDVGRIFARLAQISRNA